MSDFDVIFMNIQFIGGSSYAEEENRIGFALAALLFLAGTIDLYFVISKFPVTIAVDAASGSVPRDERYSGPQIQKIRLLNEGPFLEIY